MNLDKCVTAAAKTTSAILTAIGLAACSTSTDTPTPEPRPVTPEQQVVDSARQFAALDGMPKTELLDTATNICNVMDEYGPRWGTPLTMDLINQHMDDDAVAVAMSIVAFDAVRAFCPEHADGMEAWAEGQRT